MEPNSRDPFALTGKKKIHPHRLDPQVWRTLLTLSGVQFIAWFLHLTIGSYRPVGGALTALFLISSWGLAVRLLLLESQARRFWLVWVLGAAAFVVLSGAGSPLWIVGVSVNSVFLAIRLYRPFSRLTHAHRARAFFLGLLAFSLLSWGWVLGPNGGFNWNGNVAGWFQNISRFSLVSLEIFWVCVLLHIFFKARLHSVKIRAKLTAGTILIAGVPILIVLIMSGAVVLSLMGESQAARSAKVMNDWAELVGQDPHFGQALSKTWFLREETGTGEGREPSWLSAFRTVADKTNPDGLPGSFVLPQSAFYCWVGPELWLLKRAERGRSWGCLVDSFFLSRLARISSSDIQITFSGALTVEGATLRLEDARTQGKLLGRFDPSGTPLTLWYGMTNMDASAFANGAVVKANILLSLKTSFALIKDEVYSSKNPLSRVIISALIVLGVLLFLLEAVFLFFGIRISVGITSAVRTLHLGTRRIAAGDLNTKIEIPNEDELGDLAASLNEMAAAVKRGREELLKREHLERELEVAREIQERLLPHEMPRIPGFEISGISLPSQQVSGDYFDFLDMPDGRLGIAIADVSGKGIPAALLMANLQAVLHGQAEGESDAAAVVSRINNFLVRSTDARMFATFVYGLLDRRQAVFSLANAGHNPPMIVRADGRIERLSPGGLILGFLPDQVYSGQTISIDPGEMIILYTDGITEAFAPARTADADRFFGEDRLIKVLQKSRHLSAAEVQAAILEAVVKYTGGAARNDDVTLVVLKRRQDSG